MKICASILGSENPNREDSTMKETFIDVKVTYTLELEGKV
jgi:hypothetical protein